MESGIYRIYNSKNNKNYIGSSINLKNREYKHFWMLSNNRHDNVYLQNSFNKNGRDSFVFEVLEYCEEFDLCSKENYYIEKYKSLRNEGGFNLALVTEFRRNNLIDEVKVNLSKHYLQKNKNFVRFSLTNIKNNVTYFFDSLVDAANYLIENNFTKGSNRNVRQKISYALRGKKVNNGSNGSTRKTIYKHTFQVIN